MTDELHPQPADGVPDELADELADDPMIARMRSALDEAARIDPGTAKPAPAPDRRRWLAVAAAAVLVIGAVAAIAANRGNDGSSSDDSIVPDTTTPHSDSVPNSEDLNLNWFVLDLPGFTSQPDRKEVCCPPLPAPGPATTIAWGDVNGLDRGVLLLTVTPKVEGEPQLDYAWAGMTDERAGQLISEVVPGSGLPYVMPSQSMRFLGTGLAGFGDLRGQAWANSDGTVDITVGDYRGQLDVLTTGSVEATTIAGQDAYRVRRGGGDAVVWQTPDGHWATVTIDDRGLTEREDEIFAAVEPGPMPSAPTDTTTVDSTVDSKPIETIVIPRDDVVYKGNVGGIIDSGDGRGPMLTWFWLDSYPPQGGSIPVEGFDWDMIDGEQTANTTTWLEEPLGVVGTFDGTTFTLTEPPSPPFSFTDDVLTYGAVTEGCTDADIAPALAALQALDHVALGIIESSDYRWDGHCGVQLRAMFDSEGLRNAIRTLGDDVMVGIAFRPVQP